ncbi:hypothetical protein AB0N05_05830 [Nocardia sp. NPDC051030]|uniref:hypothetical protein n=1 Tax=Nocardia sp. NPDC051030 TaxID=3155162 RepID=UPI003443A570
MPETRAISRKSQTDVSQRIQSLRIELWQLIADDRLIAPEGIDVADVIGRVDKYLDSAEGLLRTEFGHIREFDTDHSLQELPDLAEDDYAPRYPGEDDRY